MNQGRTSRPGGAGAPVEDPERIRFVLEELRASETEFPIKVEGTHTLPYTARVDSLEADALNLKLIRPLPHELAAGAPFEMMFATVDQRFRALVDFRGRKDYLLYQFSLPAKLIPSDQRRHKRYPFRPREKAYVLAQDGGVPGHGFSGPLVNLSLGGLAFRVDRVLRLDDHLLISPGAGFFEKGKILPMVKIRDLPKLPLFEARGKVANATERGSEIIVGVEFGELNAAELTQLKEVLELRERMMHAPASVLPDLPPAAQGGGSQGTPTSPRIPPSGAENPLALRFLGRRAFTVYMAMPPGTLREETRHALAQAGYLRLETVDSLPQALALLRADRGTSNRLLVTSGEALQDGELAEIQAFQRDLGDLCELPVAIQATEPGSQVDPGNPLIRCLPQVPPGEGAWIEALDDIAGLV